MKKILIAAAATAALLSGPVLADDSNSDVGPASTSIGAGETNADTGNSVGGMGEAKRNSSGATVPGTDGMATTEPSTGTSGTSSSTTVVPSDPADTIHNSDTNVDDTRGGRSGTMSGSGGSGN